MPPDLLQAVRRRHGHEAAAFEQAVTSGLIAPRELTIVPGVIDTTAARVEHPALVAERLLRFVRAAGHPSRVIASRTSPARATEALPLVHVLLVR